MYCRQTIRMDVLPDDVLHEIFEFYAKMYSPYGKKTEIEAWQTLIHVCRRWRSLVLGSPRRLNLHLCCTPETRARDTLDIWPTLPLIVMGNIALSSGTDNIVAALGQNNRVCRVDLLGLAGRQSEEVLAAMQVPFPKLTHLRLRSYGETPPVIPDSFSGGSAPCLQYFELSAILFPGLPKLLLSANHLVDLRLLKTHHSGYISPEAMVNLLSVLTSLVTLYLEFLSSRSRPNLTSRSLPPPKRSILPALSSFGFYGVTEYLDEFVTFIDAPQLKTFNIHFLRQIDFNTPRLTQFIDRTPELRKRDEAHVRFYDFIAQVELRAGSGTLEISIPCIESDRQRLSSIGQVCNSSLHPLSSVEDLYIEVQYSKLVWKNDAIENTLWLQLLRPFTAVKNLYLSREFAPRIAAVLREFVGDRITEVLPSLQKIFVGGFESLGPFQENIGHFVSARQLSDHPIAISVWEKLRPS
jgi:hypothetical protein